MFQSIDHNHNGEIDKTELRNAFAKSGVTVSTSNLDEFFADVDKNNDGVISYAEWRFEYPRFTAQIHCFHSLLPFTAPESSE
jgi:Ca2+-binding EF-hand superfamily protein